MGALSVIPLVGQAAFALVVGAALIGIGWPVALRLDRGHALTPGERVGAAFLIGSFAVYFGVFLIGTWWLNLYGMGGLLAALLLAAIPGWRMLPWRELGHLVRFEGASARRNPLLALLWLALIGTAISALVQGLAPPNDYDSLMYQLSMPQFDVEAGRRIQSWGVGASHLKTLFPEMMGHHSRLALALAGPGAAQMIHGLFSLVAAGWAAALVRRAGAGTATAALAALMFLGCRAVVWEMASVEVDAPLAAYMGLAGIAYLAWRKTRSVTLIVLFGIALGGGVLVKYHGFAIALAFVPLMFWDLLRERGNRMLAMTHQAIGAASALVVLFPHMVRNALESGNPVFPLFNQVFNPGDPAFFVGTDALYGTGRGLIDLLIAPWTLSILPMHHYDGMVLGTPYLLAFLPLVLFRPQQARALAPMLGVVAVYFVEWFYLLSEQVRFLLPVLPVLAAGAALGAGALWSVASRTTALRWSTIAVFAVFAVVQSAFVGIYAMLRIPPAIGWVSAAAFHEKTPTMTGATYGPCMYIRQRLKPGDRYYSLMTPHSYYCPQAPVVWQYFDDEQKWWADSENPPEMTLDEFIRRADALQFRFFITRYAFENRRNDTGEAITLPVELRTRYRFGDELEQAFAALTPLAKDSFAAVYDGPAVIARLKALR